MRCISYLQEQLPRMYAQLLPHPFFLRYRSVVLYFIFGVTAASVDVSVYMVFFNLLHVDAIIANTISVGTATAAGFLLNAIINFRVENRLLLRFLSYAAVSFLGYLVSSGMIYYFHEILAYGGNLIKILSLPVIFAMQYVLNYTISFRKNHR